LDPERKEVVEADESASSEGDAGGAKRRDLVPEALLQRFHRDRRAGACVARVVEELGRSSFLRRSKAGTAEQARVSEAGKLEVGVPQ
jgi:hypothetical protein